MLAVPVVNLVKAELGVVEATLDRLERLFTRTRFRFASERQLQQGLLTLLRSAGEDVAPEHVLSPRERLDFFVEQRVAVEVKTRGSLTDVELQLIRYAEHPQIEGLLLATARMQLGDMPTTINGKPLRVVRLARSGL